MTLSIAEFLVELARVKVIPVLRSLTAEQAVATSRALAAGGLTISEITFSTPNAPEAIAAVTEDPTVLVGAGTITTKVQAAAAVEAGAQFLVSPVWLPWLPEFAADAGVHAIPGAATPTEIWNAHDAGSAAVKVFPAARLGGAAYIRDLLAPFPSLNLMATGGVNLALARELLSSGCIAVGVGKIATGEDDEQPAQVRAQNFLQAIRR